MQKKKEKQKENKNNKIKGRKKYRKTKSQALEACWGSKVSHLPVHNQPPCPKHPTQPPTNPSGLEVNWISRNP